METAIFLNGKRCKKTKFAKEEILEKLLIDNHKLLFGSKTVFIEKTKIKTEVMGNSIPDGFLFDLSDPDNPQFYIVEVELSHHDFYRHIFPQLTKFIAFFNSLESRNSLINKLFEIIKANPDILSQFKDLLSGREVFKTITDSVENSQNILLIIDKDKPEIAESKRAYVEWDRLIKVGILSHYEKDNQIILSLSPPFEEVEISSTSGEVVERYDEDYHLDSAEQKIKEIYEFIKKEMLRHGYNINPQHYYISIVNNKNFAFFKIRKTKLHIVIMLPIEKGNSLIKNHKISSLSEGVQNFYNGSCFKVTIEDNKNLDEIINILKITAKQN